MDLRRTLATVGLIVSFLCLMWLIVAVSFALPPSSNDIRFHGYAPEGTTMQVRDGTLALVGAGSLATSAVVLQDISHAALALCSLIAISTCFMILREGRSKGQVQRLPTHAS